MTDTLHAAPFEGFSPAAFAFLRELDGNNSADWFKPRKGEYERRLRDPMRALVAALADGSLPFRGDPAKAVFRVNRDVRFSADKRPYKAQVSAALTRSGDKRDAGVLYLHIGARESFLACGFYHPDPPLLEAIRRRVIERPQDWASMLDELGAGGLALADDAAAAKRLPRGYEAAKNTSAEPHLKRKSFVTDRLLTEEECADPALADIARAFAEASRALVEFGWAALAQVDPAARRAPARRAG